MTTTKFCTTRTATRGACGQPGVYFDAATGYVECATCAAQHGSMAQQHAAGYRAGRSTAAGEHAVGDRVEVRRYGKVYWATVTRVGARGAAWATFRYGNGAERTVRVGS